MRVLKHLPDVLWPQADRLAFEAAYELGDQFDDSSGSGAHLAAGSRSCIRIGYSRWLGFLYVNHPDDLLSPPDNRVSSERVRDFVGHLNSDMRPASVAVTIQSLYYAARLIAPEGDWRWLLGVKANLVYRARPRDRLHRLVPPSQTLDFGIELMDLAFTLPITSHKTREVQYRDGLIIALLSLWPIRRRSLAALTLSKHLEIEGNDINLLLYPADTKSKRFESFHMPAPLVPYMKRYLTDIRSSLLGPHSQDGLWASYRHTILSPSRLYDIARARLIERFGKDMCLHDFRRSAATHLAIDAPEQIGLIPGVLQHASTEIGERHYNLANAIKASQRFAQHRTLTKDRLRQLAINANALEVAAYARSHARRKSK